MLVYTGKHNIFNHDYTSEVQEIILLEYQGNQRKLTTIPLSYKFAKLLIQSGAQKILEIINCSFILIETIFYIISTYTYPETNSPKQTTNKVLNIIEIIFLVYFILLFILKFFISQNRIAFFLDFQHLIDLTSIVCIILSKTAFVSANEDAYYLRLFRVVRFLNLIQAIDILQDYLDEITTQKAYISIYAMSIILLCASLTLEMENHHLRTTTTNDADVVLYRFHHLLYFSIVTISTFGFGDIYPVSTSGRFVLVLTMIVILVVIPPLTSQLSVLSGLTSKYSREKYTRSRKTPQHLVLIGDCGPESYDACLQELYNEDHGDLDFDTVIMQSEPDEDLPLIFKDTTYSTKVFYLAGNALEHKDLKRCRSENCLCVILLANKHSTKPKDEDAKTIMKALTIRKHSYRYGINDNLNIYMQLLLPETKKMYFSALTKDSQTHDQIICVEEIKLQMLGKSCVCPGINTIIASLTTSNKPTVNDDLGDNNNEEWYKEYLEGLGTEIYNITIKAELLHGLTFNDLAKIVYELTGLAVIGIDVVFEYLEPFVCLNPSAYVIKPFNHVVYVLAKSQPKDAEVNQVLQEYLEKKHPGIINTNKEMVKIQRMKNRHFANRDENGRIINKHLVSNNNANNKEDSNNNSTKDSFINISHIPTFRFKSHNNNNNSLCTSSSLNFNFLRTLHPRTQHNSENFSEELLDHHIVICGIGPNLRNLIMPLRSRSSKIRQLPILIIDKAEHIPSEIWKEIHYFPDVYFMQGNPNRREDLKSAKIAKADAVIILSDKANDPNQIGMIDNDTIFIYKAIKEETNKVLIIAELASASAISYLNVYNTKRNTDNQVFWLNEAFASGELFISSMLDTLICQTFYNPYILNILQQLILGDASFTINEPVLSKLKEKNIIQSTLYLFKIKECFERFKIVHNENTITYEKLFVSLNENGVVPIGLLRSKEQSAGTKQHKKYVYLCPKKDSVVNVDYDMVYALSTEEEVSEDKNTRTQKDYAVSNLKLIEEITNKSGTLLNHFRQKREELRLDIKNNMSVKQLVNHTRNSLRNELVNVNKMKEDEIMNDIHKELNNNKSKISDLFTINGNIVDEKSEVSSSNESLIN